MKALAERFWEKVRRVGPSSCWEWTAHCDRRGYGEIGSSGNRGKPHLRAHRVSWEIHNGPIPDGLFVLHRCDNRKCVNPHHLFLGTAKDNTQDMLAKGRGVEPPGTVENRAKTECPNGHPYNASNLRHDSRGSRYCIACKRDKKRIVDARQKRARPA